MNLTALIASFIGVVLMAITVGYGNSIQNRWVRYAVALVGVLLAITAVGYLPSILGDPSTQASAKAGEYLAYIIVAYIAIKTIFFRQ
ncbi:MAG: hypothetical protein ACRBEE_09245 [Arenicella sp.]